MKKILTLFLCAAAALSMTACKADKEPLSSDTDVRSVMNASSDESISSEENIPSDNDVSSDMGNSSASDTSEEYTEYRSLTVLGDSIASGCMLPQYEAGNNYSAPLSFGNMLGSKFESYQNFVVDGRTTEELLNELRSSEELAETVSNSDVIVISIGGNDFL